MLGIVGVLQARPSAGAEETPAPRIHAIHFSGNHALSTTSLQARIGLRPDEVFSPARLKLAVSLLESTYRNEGYYSVALSTQVVPVPPQSVELVFRIEEGPLFRIGKVDVFGNRHISRKIIERELGVRSGELFSQSRILDGYRQLYMTGFFDAIDISYSTSTAHHVDVMIRIRERATHYVKGGLGYGTQTKERATIGYEDMNFLGNARRWDLSATHSGFITEPDKFRTTILQTSLLQPYIFGTLFEGQTNVSREWQNREAFDSATTAWRSTVGRRFGADITGNLRYRYQTTSVHDVSPEAETPGFTNISAVGPSYTYDNTNDPFLPTIGWRVMGAFEEGLRFFAGDVRFHRLESRVGRFDRLFKNVISFLGLQAGMVRPFSRDSKDIIPIFERYFVGGANTVRGYGERELGPRDSSGTPLGGNAFLIGNLELRHRLYKKIFGVAFIDGGQLYPTEPREIWPHSQMKSLGDFRYGTGYGIRLHSPVGAIRLELGYKLNPEGGGRGFFDRTALHFSIGEVF